VLHDTGKASGARHHAEASAHLQKVASPGFSLEKRRRLILLVDHHHMTLQRLPNVEIWRIRQPLRILQKR